MKFEYSHTEIMNEIETAILQKTINVFDNNKSATADYLQLKRTTLMSKLQAAGISNGTCGGDLLDAILKVAQLWGELEAIEVLKKAQTKAKASELSVYKGER